MAQYDGFFTFNQPRSPGRYGSSRRFATMPSNGQWLDVKLSAARWLDCCERLLDRHAALRAPA